MQPSKGGFASRWSTNTCLGLTDYTDQPVVFARTSNFDLILDKNTWAGWLISKKAPQECFFVRRINEKAEVERRSSEREPADSLRDEFKVIGGWLPSLTFAFDEYPIDSWNSPSRIDT